MISGTRSSTRRPSSTVLSACIRPPSIYRYAIVDKASFLDWGLTSDYTTYDPGAEEGGLDGPRAGRRERAQRDVGQLPSFAQHASRNQQRGCSTGLGLGTRGSEGYGEATTGSCQKIGSSLPCPKCMHPSTFHI